KDRRLIEDATEIRMRAERRAGELLAEMDKNRGAIPGKTGRKGKPVLDPTPKLADLSITKTQSSRWQQLAGLPEQGVEDKVTRAAETAVAAVDAPSGGKQPGKSKRKPPHEKAQFARLRRAWINASPEAKLEFVRERWDEIVVARKQLEPNGSDHEQDRWIE